VALFCNPKRHQPPPRSSIWRGEVLSFMCATVPPHVHSCLATIVSHAHCPVAIDSVHVAPWCTQSSTKHHTPVPLRALRLEAVGSPFPCLGLAPRQFQQLVHQSTLLDFVPGPRLRVLLSFIPTTLEGVHVAQGCT
jgi:hypothetical protein